MTQQTPFSSLFRAEVTASQSQQWLGDVRLAQPLSGWLVSAVAAIITAVLISYITLGSVTKKARVTGVTVPIAGSISVVASAPGILIHSFVHEGEAVKMGQKLFELSTEKQGDRGEISALVGQQLATRKQTLETELRLRLAQYSEKKTALNERLGNLREEASQLEREIALTRRRHELAQNSVTKFETLQSSGYISAMQAQQKQEELIDVDSRLSGLERAKVQLQANQLALQAELNAQANSLATDQAQLERALASLRQEMAENQGRKSIHINASQDGTITTLTSPVGQSINGGQILATLVAGGTQIRRSLEVQLYAPSRAAGFVREGQRVMIRYQAYPYQKFGLQGGTVTDVSKTPFAPTELPPSLASTILSTAQQNIAGTNTSEALYRIRVRLDRQEIMAYGQPQALKPGMTLEADVLQDRRKIWEWIMEPVLAIAGY